MVSWDGVGVGVLVLVMVVATRFCPVSAEGVRLFCFESRPSIDCVELLQYRASIVDDSRTREPTESHDELDPSRGQFGP